MEDDEHFDGENQTQSPTDANSADDTNRSTMDETVRRFVDNDNKRWMTECDAVSNAASIVSRIMTPRQNINNTSSTQQNQNTDYADPDQ